MRTLKLTAMLVLLGATVLGAQQTRPNFSGHWTAVSETGGTAGPGQIVAVGARPDGGRAFFFFNEKEAMPRGAGQPFFFFNGPTATTPPQPLPDATLTLTQDAATLKVEYGGPAPRPALTYKLDGSESRNVPPPIGDSAVVSTASWDGGKLVITHVQTASVQQQAVTITSTQTLSLDAEGRLVVETKHGNTTSRTTYKKN